MAKRGRAIAAALVAAAVVALPAACGADSDDQAATGNAPPKTPQGAYEAAGCANCHGVDGQGGSGPALAGHTEAQIDKQVREPVGSMPEFSEGDLPDEQLALVVAYIEGLEGEAHDDDHTDTTGAEDHTEDEMDGDVDDPDTGAGTGEEGKTPDQAPSATTEHPDDGHTH